tara:strand:- start:237 stop:704 length:468 start_codon:yes stop_codon:yes gene_type:complete
MRRTASQRESSLNYRANSPTEPTSLKRCNKCGSIGRFELDQDGHDICIICGWTDYSEQRKRWPSKELMDDLRPSIMIIPYVGKGNVFSGRRLKILIPPNSKANNIHYETDCPICEDSEPMIQIQKQKKKNTVMICRHNHQICLVERDDRSLVGWL